MAVEFAPAKEACRLWARDIKTLKKWANRGEIRSQIINPDKGNKANWYFETPQARYERLHMQ